jgi:YD repeat-containing protein
MVDARGKTTTYAHDATGHMTGLTDPDSGAIGWTFDGLGRRTGQTNRGDATPASPTVGWTYDGAGRVLSRTFETARPTRLGRSHCAAGVNRSHAAPLRLRSNHGRPCQPAGSACRSIGAGTPARASNRVMGFRREEEYRECPRSVAELERMLTRWFELSSRPLRSFLETWLRLRCPSP